MTKRERVRAAVLHQQPDVTPWNLELTRPALEALAALRRDPSLVDATRFGDWVGNHIATVEPRGGSLFHGLVEEVSPGLWRDGWGVVWDVRGLYGEGEWGTPVGPPLSEPSLRGYRLPDAPGPEAFAHYPEAISALGGHFVVGMEGHLFEVAYALRGMEAFLLDMVASPGFVDDLMQAVTEHYLAFIDESVRYPIDAMAFGDDWGAERGLIMGPRLWRRFIKPHMARLFKRVHAAGKFVLIHSDGDLSAILDDLIEIGLDIYNPFQPDVMDVYAIKRRCGDRLSFYGGISVQALLPLGTPAQVREETRRMIAEVGAGGGYILAPSHAVLGDTPAENLAALIEVLHNQ
jgi:uroporphyrinogen decarboxylase